MLIQELYDQNQPEDFSKPRLDYDLKEDLLCFMRNDPQFYRTEYFPLMHKFKAALESGRSVSARAFEGLCTKAYEEYKKKFKHIKGLEEDLQNDVRSDICKEIHGSESEHIKNGHYDE